MLAFDISANHPRSRSVIPDERETWWERALLRALQSWRDTANAASHDWRYAASCEECEDSKFLAAIPKSRPWPHWMLHGLRRRIHELRSDELFLTLAEPYKDGETLGQQYGRGPLSESSATHVVDGHMREWDRWLRRRLMTIEAWEVRVLGTAELDRGVRLSVREAIDGWLTDYEFSRRGEMNSETTQCVLCVEFFLLDAAELPAWVTHKARHALAAALLDLIERYDGYRWRPPSLRGPVDGSRVDDLEDPDSWDFDYRVVEHETYYFLAMRQEAHRLASALERVRIERERSSTDSAADDR